MTTTAQAIKRTDGSTRLIQIVHTHSDDYGSVHVEFSARWEDLRDFAGYLLEIIKQAEANSDHLVTNED